MLDSVCTTSSSNLYAIVDWKRELCFQGLFDQAAVAIFTEARTSISTVRRKEQVRWTVI
jgi:hypothetical protein